MTGDFHTLTYTSAHRECCKLSADRCIVTCPHVKYDNGNKKFHARIFLYSCLKIRVFCKVIIGLFLMPTQLKKHIYLFIYTINLNFLPLHSTFSLKHPYYAFGIFLIL